MTPGPEWDEMVRGFIREPEWIMDGNYGSSLHERIPAADTVVFLDMPRWLCVCRILRRRVRYYGRSRPDLDPGCPEKIDREFFSWVFHWHRRNRPRVLERIAEHGPGKTVVTLRPRREVRAWLDRVSCDPPADPS
jgi:adenylate kinase family enzyme